MNTSIAIPSAGTRLVHIAEAAQALNLSVSNMYRLAREGTIPSVRIGKRWLFDVDTIIKAMMAQTPNKVQSKPRRKAPVPTVTAPSPETMLAEVNKALYLAADAVKQAAEVMSRAAAARGQNQTVQ